MAFRTPRAIPSLSLFLTLIWALRWALRWALIWALLISQGTGGQNGPPARPRVLRDPYFGVNAHIPSKEDLAHMEQSGFGYVRVDFTWDAVEPERGAFRWDITDEVVRNAEARGIRLVAILGYCPRWASSGPDIHDPPKNVREWKGFVAAIVGRYKGRIRDWILWNEPNSPDFFKGTTEQFIREVLIPGARAAKEADPGCRIVGPDLAHLESAHWDTWLDKILAEAGSYLDVISHHCYKDSPSEVFRMLEGPSRPWEPPPVQQVIERRGQEGKPFWLTEVGWRSDRVGKDRQAGYLVSLLKGANQRRWISKVFIYELRDSPQEPGFGLLHYSGKPKPSYTAVAGYIRSMSAGQQIAHRLPPR